jgi:hypothetical protein
MPRFFLQRTAMTTQHRLDNLHDVSPIPNVLVPLAADDERALLKRLELARAISVSPRTVDNLQRQKKIPFIRISPEGEINGKRTKMQDLWTDITPNSHTLTAAYDTGDGVMKPYVVSHSTRE